MPAFASSFVINNTSKANAATWQNWNQEIKRGQFPFLSLLSFSLEMHGRYIGVLFFFMSWKGGIYQKIFFFFNLKKVSY